MLTRPFASLKIISLSFQRVRAALSLADSPLGPWCGGRDLRGVVELRASPARSAADADCRLVHAAGRGFRVFRLRAEARAAASPPPSSGRSGATGRAASSCWRCGRLVCVVRRCCWRRCWRARSWQSVPCRSAARSSPPAFRAADVVAVSILIILTAGIVVRPFSRVASPLPDGGKAYRAYFTADFIWRMAVAAELAKGDVPPVNPFHRNDYLHYYWLPHLLPAAEYREMRGVGQPRADPAGELGGARRHLRDVPLRVLPSVGAEPDGARRPPARRHCCVRASKAPSACTTCGGMAGRWIPCACSTSTR